MDLPEFGKVSLKEIRNITMVYLDKMVLSRIRLSYWTLFLEFWKLDKEGHKWEVSFMIDPSWNFQDGYCIKENVWRGREDLEEWLAQYIWKRLMYCVIDEYSYELRLDFRDILFSTLSTTEEEELWRVVFFNEHSKSTDTEPISRTMLSPKKDWIYFSRVLSDKEADEAAIQAAIDEKASEGKP